MGRKALKRELDRIGGLRKTAGRSIRQSPALGLQQPMKCHQLGRSGLRTVWQKGIWGCCLTAGSKRASSAQVVKQANGSLGSIRNSAACRTREVTVPYTHHWQGHTWRAAFSSGPLNLKKTWRYWSLSSKGEKAPEWSRRHILLGMAVGDGFD